MVHQRRSRAPFWFPSGANTRYRLPTLGYKKYALACQCRFITSHTPDIMSAAVDPYADRKKLYSYETPADALLWKNSNELVEDHDGGEEVVKHIRVILPDYGWEFSDEGYVGQGACQSF